ncbi:MAG: hypothetical protein JJT96_19685 [Opitutales bacterium]|nr:hypothetical protein [Opitutales bacterium]
MSSRTPSNRSSAFTRAPLAVFCATFALFAFASPAAHAHLVLCFKPNVCFAERVGDILQPAWNVPIEGEATEPVVADPEGEGPVFVVIPDDVIGDDYFDWLDVYIFGLSLGQSVLLERFLVDNDEGIINANAVLMESHRMQDGFLPLTGGIPNLSSVEDWDGERDGEIWTQLGMFGGLANMPGEYVVRVSSPFGSFEPAKARLTIEEVPTSQLFFGEVVDEEGTPIPHAFVALLEPLGNYSEILFAAQADEDGFYLLYAPYPDEVDVVAVAPGYVGPFQDGNYLVIDEGEIVFHDIVLTPGTVALSGQILTAGTDEPLAGLPVSFLTVDENGDIDGRLMAHTWTDADGAFSVMVTPDRWVLLVKTYEAASRNLINRGLDEGLIVDTSDGHDVTGWVVHYERGTSVIAGFLEDVDGFPLKQVQVMALNRETNESVSAYTLADGSFTLPAKPGDWEVLPFSFDLEVAGHPGAVETRVRLTAPNQSVIIAPRVFEQDAILEGFVTYESADPELDGTPVGGLQLWAQNIVEGEVVSVFQRTFNSSGYYNIFLPEGDWFVVPEPFESARRQLLLKNLPRLEVEYDDFIENISWDITAVDAERVIEVTITDAGGNPVPGIPMHAEMSDGIDTYDAFGVTNADGVATIPARAGHWEVHISHSTMRRAGFMQFAHQHVMVSAVCGSEECACGAVALNLTAVPFTGALPEVVGTRQESGKLIIEGTGEPGKLFDVEGSFNLQDWFYAGRVIALDGEFSIKDPLDAGHEEAVTGQAGKRVFYRLKNRP